MARKRDAARAQRKLDQTEDIHILHYIGHGAYDESTQTGVLLLERADGTTHPVTGAELGSLLHDERSLRLVVLNACEGARTSHRDPFSGVATSLVAYGIPAVVGMQFEITDNAAITFADQLYTSLAASFPVDASIALARRAIWADQSDTEFGTPVLFLRANDAQLFEVKHTRVGWSLRTKPHVEGKRPKDGSQAKAAGRAPVDGSGEQLR